MPDSSPADTLEYAQRVLRRLATSAAQVTFSYPGALNDAEQSASELLRELKISEEMDSQDPGWNATTLLHRVSISSDISDPVPALSQGEVLAGGAATLQRQFNEPFAAFVVGRLGVRGLWPVQPGLPPNLRGSLIHNALQRLYAECPSSDDIQRWDSAEIEARTAAAVDSAFRTYERFADETLLQLLQLEKSRVQQLLRGVIVEDASRDEFKIAAVELDLQANVAGLPLRLRVDRIDLDATAQQIVIDYKTGAPKRLLDRDQNPKDMQLIVYTCALQEAVSGIGLFNIDSRDIALDAAGRSFTEKLDWDASLADWREQVETAAGQIVAGDVRLNTNLSVQQSRPFSLLSRIRELAVE